MYVNVELKQLSLDKLIEIVNAGISEPIPHSSITCGYSTLNFVYDCSKTDAQKIKQHWRGSVSDCLITSV